LASVNATHRSGDLEDQFQSLYLSKSVPALLNYQGYLANSSDSSAITDTLEMTFRLFDSQTKGAELWAEAHPAVEVTDGLFQVLLGGMTPFPLNLFDENTLWLQTEIGTEALSPRKPLVSAAYSQRSGDADYATTAEWATDAQHAIHADTAAYSPSASVWAVSGDDVYRETGKVGIGVTSPTHPLEVNGSVNATAYFGDGSNLTGISGTTDHDWTISGDDIYHETGNVGIGTASPAVRLDVCDPTHDASVNVHGQDDGKSSYELHDGAAYLRYDEAEAEVRLWNAATGGNAGSLSLGTSDLDRMRITKDGDVGIGTISPAARLDVRGTLNVGEDDTGYDVNFYGAESGGRLFWDEDKMAFRAGQDPDGTHWASDSIGVGSFATGYSTMAKGPYAIAMGVSATASGSRAIALGQSATASGQYAVAIGLSTTADGPYSTAMGNNTSASGNYSTAMGYFTTAGGDFSTAIGGYLATGPAANTIVLGKGASLGLPLSNNIENSLMVGFNTTTPTLFVGGSDHRVGIGTETPGVKLHVTGGTDVDDETENSGYFIIGSSTAQHLAFDGNELMSKGSGTSVSTLYLQNEGGTTSIGGNVQLPNIPTGSGTSVLVTGAGTLVKQSASKRHMRNIKDLVFEADKIVLLHPVSFSWATTGEKSLGLIAEEVVEVMPDLVIVDADGKPDVVDYDRLTLCLLELVQRQQERITALEEKIDRLQQ
jgi:hypothetical protein